MLIYGKNAAREVINSGIKIKKILLSNNYSDKEIMSLIKKNNLRYFEEDKNKLDKIVEGNTNGILIDIEPNFFVDYKEMIEDIESNFIVVLDHIEDPHNFGAIIRTCECAGVNYIVIPNKGNAEVNSTVMKTSSGALVNSKIVIVSNLRNTLEDLKRNGFWVVGTDADGEDYTKINYEGKTALVIGSEGHGLKEIVKSSCDFIASIPMKGKINSLNASVASAIMIYEILKTRK